MPNSAIKRPVITFEKKVFFFFLRPGKTQDSNIMADERAYRVYIGQHHHQRIKNRKKEFQRHFQLRVVSVVDDPTQKSEKQKMTRYLKDGRRKNNLAMI